MKTLKQFVEGSGYLNTKSPDEQKFVDKHKTVTIADPAGNGDDVFKAANIKKVERKKDRKGYETGEDAAVYEGALKDNADKRRAMYTNKGEMKPIKLTKGWGDGGKSMKANYGKLAKEEVEPIDEISMGLAKRYHSKANDSGVKAVNQKRIFNGWDQPDVDKTIEKRKKGLAAAIRRRDGKVPVTKEEVDQIDELSKKTLIKYSSKSTEDQFNAAFDGDDKRISKRAKGEAAARKKIDAKNEEVEQMDELSKKTLASYVDKANDQIDRAGEGQLTPDEKARNTASKRKIGDKRFPGTRLAVKKYHSQVEDFEEAISGLPSSTQDLLENTFSRLSEDNQSKFVAACQTEEGLEKMVGFAIENRGV
tara:strand:- start:2475 stop:3566 length:1092 start_codon:yes stop_codon:yes gene_type:complete